MTKRRKITRWTRVRIPAIYDTGKFNFYGEKLSRERNEWLREAVVVLVVAQFLALLPVLVWQISRWDRDNQIQETTSENKFWSAVQNEEFTNGPRGDLAREVRAGLDADNPIKTLRAVDTNDKYDDPDEWLDTPVTVYDESGSNTDDRKLSSTFILRALEINATPGTTPVTVPKRWAPLWDSAFGIASLVIAAIGACFFIYAWLVEEVNHRIPYRRRVRAERARAAAEEAVKPAEQRELERYAGELSLMPRTPEIEHLRKEVATMIKRVKDGYGPTERAARVSEIADAVTAMKEVKDAGDKTYEEQL